MRVALNRKRGRSKKLFLFFLFSIFTVYLAFNYNIYKVSLGIIGFMWPYALRSSDSIADVATRSYRFSFLKLIFLVDSLLPKVTWLKDVSYILIPSLIFSLITYPLTGEFAWPAILGGLSWYIYAQVLRLK